MRIHDPETERQLQHQHSRRAAALAECPPDRVEAQACLDRIDDILDRQPRPIAVAPDGEVILDNQSPWVLAQTTAVNATGEPERIIPLEDS